MDIGYLILTFIIIILIIVISWVIFDYYKFKDDLETKLETTFSKYKETDDTLSTDIKSSSNLIHTYSSNIYLNTSNYVNDSKKNYIENTSNFNNNLSKYFKFGNDTDGISSFNNKLYEYTTWDANKDNKLELIQETTTAANLRLKTSDVKGLDICDLTGEKCYKLYVSGSNLHINTPTGGGDLRWGDKDSIVSFNKGSSTQAVSAEEAMAANTAASTAKTNANDASLDADNKKTTLYNAITNTDTKRDTYIETPATPAPAKIAAFNALNTAKAALTTSITDAVSSADNANNYSSAAILAANANGVTNENKNSALDASVKASNSAKSILYALPAARNANR